MLERGSKVFGCFLDVRKAFDTVRIDGLLHKLFTEFDIRGRMWLAIKDLYTEVRGQVFYSSTLSRRWRYEFNHTKSGVVTYGETKPVHFEEMKECEWILGDGTVDEL